jgi:hypothetical protein
MEIRIIFIFLCKSKGKTIPLDSWTGPEVSKSLKLPDFKQSSHEGDKVVNPTHQLD